jgi:hypothetical protein
MIFSISVKMGGLIEISRPDSGRVVASTTPWAASADPFDSLPSADDRSVFIDCINRILAAGWCEAALPAEQAA